MQAPLTAFPTALLVAAFAATPADAVPVLRFSTSGPAELVMTGNVLGLGGDLDGPSTAGRIGVFSDADLVLQEPGWPLGTTADWALASSDAVLDLPAGAVVLYAELVWGGTLDAIIAADADGPVTFVTPSGAQHRVMPGVAAVATPGSGFYGRSAEVSELVEGAGTYRVGAVPASLEDEDAAAGWSLYVVYRVESSRPRRISIFDVMATVTPESDPAEASAEIDGVCVPSAVGDRDVRTALSVLDGDRGIEGDSFRMAPSADHLDDASARVSADGIPPNNLFGGRITDSDGVVDKRGTFGNANHVLSSNIAGARQGWDALTVPGGAQLEPAWTSAWLRGTAGDATSSPGVPDDSYALLAVGVSLALRTPYLPDVGSTVLAATPAEPEPGEVATLSVTLENAGDAAAEGLVFRLPDALPSAIGFVADSFEVDGAPPSGGAVTVASALVAGVDLGDLGPGETMVVTLQLSFGDAPGLTSWSFAPRVTYRNAACAGAETTPFAPAPLVFALAECGDGEVVGGEGCDDGDRSVGDGCDASCTVEPGWRCASDGGASVCAEDCGDGAIVGAEVCDDGVAQGDEADGCNDTCRKIDHGWSCLGEPSDCRARCGDGIVALAAEACDDGNRGSGDGCSAECDAVEPGWSCGREPSVCVNNCGDGFVRASEVCDDGNLDDGDGCSATCAPERAWVCTLDADGSSTCRKDSDEDGVVDDGDDSGDRLDNPCAEGGPVTGCDDNCPDFANPDQRFPHDGSALCPLYVGPRWRGGGGCDAGGTASGLALALLAGWLLRRRVGLALLVVAGASSVRAQSFQLDPRLFEPALSPLGVLGVETSATCGNLRPWVNLVGTMADDELLTQTQPDTLVQGPLDYRFTLTFAAGIGLLDRFDVAVGLPVAVAETGIVDRGAQSDMGMTDLRVLARGRVLGPDVGGEGPGLALAVHLTFPTGSDTPFMSDGAMTAMPQLVLDYRSVAGFIAALNVGYRFRPERHVDDLVVGNELRVGLGLEIPVMYGFALVGEVDAALSFATSPYDEGGIAARELPVEALAGMRWRSGGGVTISGAIGGGLTEGYGAPDFRALFGLAFNVPAPEPFAEPIVPASRNEKKDDWVVRGPADKGPRGPPVGPEKFDQLAATDPDVDADGVSVPADVCPTIPEDRDGFLDEDGCPDPDNDEDGVFDADDKCPTELEVLNGIDDFDGCPDKPRAVVGNGIVDDQIEIRDRIRFKAGSAELLPSDELIIDGVAVVMRANPEIERFRIEAHTDNLGDRERNVDLAERRAWSVRAYLIEKGIAEGRLFAKGFGATRPLAKNSTEAGRAQNRRIEFHVVKEGEPPEGALP